MLMIKKKTFSCIIFENGFTILSFDGKIVGRTLETPSFYCSILLTIVVLLDSVYSIGGRRRRGGTSSVYGGCWWH